MARLITASEKLEFFGEALHNLPSMQTSGINQFELSFDAPERGGFEKWKEERQNTLRQMAKQLGLPLGLAVEVWLKGEIRLRGVLRLQEQLLLPQALDATRLMFEVDRVPFNIGDMISCVRL